MGRRNQHSRRHGHWDPRWYTPKPAAPLDSRASVARARNSPTPAFRHELRDTHGNYLGTFVTEIERWQKGDTFTAGDGSALRITGIAAAERSNERPTYTDRWNVEPADAAAVLTAATETDEPF